MRWAVNHDRPEHTLHGSGPLCTALPPACSVSRLRGVPLLGEKRVPGTHAVRMGVTLPCERGLRGIGGVTPQLDDGNEWRRPHDL